MRICSHTYTYLFPALTHTPHTVHAAGGWRVRKTVAASLTRKRTNILTKTCMRVSVKYLFSCHLAFKIQCDQCISLNTCTTMSLHTPSSIGSYRIQFFASPCICGSFDEQDELFRGYMQCTAHVHAFQAMMTRYICLRMEACMP